MKHLSYFLLTLVAISLFSSCEKMILGEPEVNSQANNFELFWTDFDQHYGLFGVRGWNWDSIYQVYEPQVSDVTPDSTLWTYFKEMIEYLDDSHTFVYDPKNDDFYASGDTRAEQAEREFSLALITSAFVDDFTLMKDTEEFGYGKMKGKNIGYIFIGDMEEGDPADIDIAIDALSETEAIIFDIRYNGGGFDEFSARIAGAFADKEELIYTVQTKSGPGPNEFDEIREYYTEPIGDVQYLKPVILLTDAYTVSAAEIFLFHMNAFDHVTQVGDTTAGDFSDTSILRFLPNGWVYQYSIQKFLLPDGSSLDGLGHVPDIYVQNSEADIQAGNDLVITEALEFLKSEYGIE